MSLKISTLKESLLHVSHCLQVQAIDIVKVSGQSRAGLLTGPTCNCGSTSAASAASAL